MNILYIDIYVHYFMFIIYPPPPHTTPHHLRMPCPHLRRLHALRAKVVIQLAPHGLEEAPLCEVGGGGVAPRPRRRGALHVKPWVVRHLADRRDGGGGSAAGGRL